MNLSSDVLRCNVLEVFRYPNGVIVKNLKCGFPEMSEAKRHRIQYIFHHNLVVQQPIADPHI